MSANAVSATPAGTVRVPSFSRRLLHRPVAVACVAYLVLLVLVAVFAPIFLPDVAHEHAGDLLSARQGPSADHLLGTDALGRDVLERLLVGTRVTIVGVAEAIVAFCVIGLPLGLAAGFYGGWIDRVVSWVADLVFSMPAIIIILVVLAVFPSNMAAAMVTFGIIAAPGLLRVVRAETLVVREELYISAARVAGLSRAYVVSRHVLPRIAGAVIVQISLLAGLALLAQTGLAFLGLVVAAPEPSWGGMVADGAKAIVLQPWLIWPPGLAIILTVLVLAVLGNAVRDTVTEGWAAPAIGRASRRRAAAARRSASSADHTAQEHEAEQAPDCLLAVKHLNVVFDGDAGERSLLDDVSFTLREGEAVGVVGESGCGKTMSALSILGLLPSGGRVSSGGVWFAGRDLTALTERQMRQVRGSEIALISQEPMVGLNPAFRVGTQLAELIRQHRGVSRKAARTQAVEALRQVRLPDPEMVARRYPHELSGGMAQRVAIARALTGQPRLLIADEPTTALDVTVQADILELLLDIQQERRMAMLMVTHDWGVVADVCDRAIVMYAGQVVEQADLRSMMRRPRHPYTEALLASDPHRAPQARTLPTIPGSVPQPGQWPAGCHFQPRCAYATDECARDRIVLHRDASGRETRCILHDQLAARG